MPTWNVTLKIQGRAEIEVEADTEREAIDEARDRCTIDDFVDWNVTSGIYDHDADCLDCEDEDEDEESEGDE